MALGGGEWSVLHCCHFTPGEIIPGNHWMVGWLSPMACLIRVAKRQAPTLARNQTWVTHSITCILWWAVGSLHALKILNYT